MTAVSTILRQLDAPPLARRVGICSAALVADADAMAAEWSRGDDLAMIDAKDVAARNATAIVLDAAIKALGRDRVTTVTTYERGFKRVTRVSGAVLADLLSAYVAACQAEADGDESALEGELELFTDMADEIADRFRMALGGAA